MAIHLRQLVKRFVGPDGSVVPVIDVASLELSDGEQVALIGTSGSGKTTLLHIIAGILAPDSGSVIFGYDPQNPTVGSVDATRLTEAQRDIFRGRYIGYIF